MAWWAMRALRHRLGEVCIPQLGLRQSPGIHIWTGPRARSCPALHLPHSSLFLTASVIHGWWLQASLRSCCARWRKPAQGQWQPQRSQSGALRTAMSRASKPGGRQERTHARTGPSLGTSALVPFLSTSMGSLCGSVQNSETVSKGPVCRRF